MKPGDQGWAALPQDRSAALRHRNVLSGACWNTFRTWRSVRWLATPARDGANWIDVMFCPDCRTNLDNIEVDLPCPGCGGSRRSAVAMPATIELKATLPEPTVRVTRNDHPSWVEKWLEVVRLRDQLTGAYAERLDGIGNVEVDAMVTRFCSECHDLRDWLVGDVAHVPGLTTGVIDAHVQSSAVLQVSSAVANSHKHHTRRPGTTTARIRSTSVTPHGARVEIEVHWASNAATVVDALTLANDCLKDWRDFLVRNGVDMP